MEKIDDLSLAVLIACGHAVTTGKVQNRSALRVACELCIGMQSHWPRLYSEFQMRCLGSAEPHLFLSARMILRVSGGLPGVVFMLTGRCHDYVAWKGLV